MAQQALARQTGTLNLFKLLWRGDATLTLISGAFIIFATSTVRDALGMSESADIMLRVEGGIFSLYALWQLWVAREGAITPRNFKIARFVMLLMGVDFLIAPLAVEFNTLGVAASIAMGIGSWLLAFIWHLALRENR
ncbi:MAG: hypothetical protein F9K46_02265 [Anaerolineae bacterium]|nr:MAG: hypothetical protein F9K46_02265 [Anaerolineae bacterium]